MGAGSTSDLGYEWEILVPDMASETARMKSQSALWVELCCQAAMSSMLRMHLVGSRNPPPCIFKEGGQNKVNEL